MGRHSSLIANSSARALMKGTNQMAEETTINMEQVSDSQSLSALFSYFRNWHRDDPTLRFNSGSIVKTDPAIEINPELNSTTNGLREEAA